MADKKTRVLLVDDEGPIIKTVGKRLELTGYEVLTAMDGESALDQAKAASPDVIILDLMLPKMNGMDVCATFKQDPKYRGIPIIIFTARGGEMDEKLCREIGADAYITKSQQSKALIEQIEILLARIFPKRPQAGP